MKLCKCGCGNEVTKECNIYLKGHYYKNRKNPEHSERMKGDNNPMKNPENSIKITGEKHGLYGKKRSIETKKKISKKLKGKMTGENNPNYNIYKYKEENPFYGKKHSEESKRKMSKKHTGKILSEETKKRMSLSTSGENNPNYEKYREKSSNWKGGISCEPYCEQWKDKEYKESIKERDGYICLNPECNKDYKRLCIHHIDYNKKNCHQLNLITVCNSCNSKANKDRKWHKSWYQAIIDRRYNGNNIRY